MHAQSTYSKTIRLSYNSYPVMPYFTTYSYWFGCCTIHVRYSSLTQYMYQDIGRTKHILPWCIRVTIGCIQQDVTQDWIKVGKRNILGITKITTEYGSCNARSMWSEVLHRNDNLRLRINWLVSNNEGWIAMISLGNSQDDILRKQSVNRGGKKCLWEIMCWKCFNANDFSIRSI